jgi:hypothetical protein
VDVSNVALRPNAFIALADCGCVLEAVPGTGGHHVKIRVAFFTDAIVGGQLQLSLLQHIDAERLALLQ